MAEELVNDVRLWGVKRGAVMSDVLRGVENLKGKPIQEFSLR
jgi:hypothetical protein